jgi:hypothetical protein
MIQQPRCVLSGVASLQNRAMLHPFHSGRSLITAATYFPACSHTCVRAKHARSDSRTRPRSSNAVRMPILTAAAAFDSSRTRVPLMPASRTRRSDLQAAAVVGRQ